MSGLNDIAGLVIKAFVPNIKDEIGFLKNKNMKHFFSFWSVHFRNTATNYTINSAKAIDCLPGVCMSSAKQYTKLLALFL